MAYISYLDLLGTKGFCENSEIYFENITEFYNSIYSLSRLLTGQGRVGVFSDCAYAESNDLEYLLDFLVELRDRLNAKGLFFNAFVKKGKLGIKDVSPKKRDELFGVVFTKSAIADLYISQSRFKGVGICIDNDTKLYKEIEDNSSYKLNNCIYISNKKLEDGTTQYIPNKYKDIAYNKPMYGDKDIKDTLHVFFETFYSAYIKSPKYGAYYISALTNFIRSNCTGFGWDLEKNDFSKCPVVFRSVYNMISAQYGEIKNLPGVDYIIFILLDVIYNSDELDDEDKKRITLKFTELPSMKDKYINSLNDIPKLLFSNNDNDKNNREILIEFCQNDFSNNYAQRLLNSNQ